MEQASTQRTVVEREPIASRDLSQSELDALPAGSCVLLESGIYFTKHEPQPPLLGPFWTLGMSSIDMESWQIVESSYGVGYQIIRPAVASWAASQSDCSSGASRALCSPRSSPPCVRMPPRSSLVRGSSGERGV